MSEPLRKLPANTASLGDAVLFGSIVRPIIERAVEELRKEIVQLRNELRQTKEDLLKPRGRPRHAEPIQPGLFPEEGTARICIVCSKSGRCEHREEGLLRYYEFPAKRSRRRESEGAAISVRRKTETGH